MIKQKVKNKSVSQFVILILLIWAGTLFAMLSGCAVSPQKTSLQNATLQESFNHHKQTRSFISNNDIWQNGNIELAITSYMGDKQTYIEGDIISYFVSSSKDAYLLIIYEDAEGNFIQILPNLYTKNSFIKAGEFIMVPKTGSQFSFEVTEPFGMEYVYAFAANKPFPPLPGVRLENDLLLLAKNQIQELIKKLRAQTGENDFYYGESVTAIATIAKSVAM